jgi:hypothetical protein
VRFLLGRLILFLGILAACAAHAEDTVILIQTGAEGYRVWHVRGESELSDDEAIELMASARPGGGEVLSTRFGPALAYELPEGILIRLPAAPRDRELLVDRDACGHVRLWHSVGTLQLSEAELTQITLSALPEGGPRLRLGNRYVKAFFGKLGITATIWGVPERK